MIALWLILYLIGGLVTFGIAFALTNYNYNEWFSNDRDTAALLMVGFFSIWPVIFILVLLILIGRLLAKLALVVGVLAQVMFDRKKNREVNDEL